MTEQMSTEPRVALAVGVDAVGPTSLARGGLTRTDYADRFTISPVDATAATPEGWARAMFGDEPDVAERLIWQVFLQLSLARGRAASTVAGWRIGERGDGWVRLETGSWAIATALVVAATDSEVSLTTMFRYDRRPGGVVCRPLSAVHRRLAPGLLRGAVRTVARAGDGAVALRAEPVAW